MNSPQYTDIFLYLYTLLWFIEFIELYQRVTKSQHEWETKYDKYGVQQQVKKKSYSWLLTWASCPDNVSLKYDGTKQIYKRKASKAYAFITHFEALTDTRIKIIKLWCWMFSDILLTKQVNKD